MIKWQDPRREKKERKNKEKKKEGKEKQGKGKETPYCYVIIIIIIMITLLSLHFVSKFNIFLHRQYERVQLKYSSADTHTLRVKVKSQSQV